MFSLSFSVSLLVAALLLLSTVSGAILKDLSSVADKTYDFIVVVRMVSSSLSRRAPHHIHREVALEVVSWLIA